MIGRLVNQALAGLNYVLILAVSVVAVVVAVVAFRPIVDAAPAVPTATSTTSSTTTPPATLPAAGAVTTAPAAYDCGRTPPADTEETRVIRLFYTCGGDDARAGAAWVYRTIDTTGDLLMRTLDAYVAGPTRAERADGFRSLFSTATAGAVVAVTNDGGDVTVDLRDLGPLPALARARDADEFLAGLNNTIFQYDAASVEYRVEGDCERFWAYVAAGGCRVVRRADWEQDPATRG